VSTYSEIKFSVGQIIHHKLFDYRGVIVDVDPVFNGTEEWYEQVARSKPPKDKPWYHVLVDCDTYQTYVAERNLEPDDSGKPIDHPLIEEIFSELKEGAYLSRSKVN